MRDKRPEKPITASEGLVQAYEALVVAMGKMGHDVNQDPNFAGTAGRAAAAFSELALPPAEVESCLQELLEGGFPAGPEQSGLVICQDTTCFGLCPHHLLPVIFTITTAYYPGERIIGVSKMARMADVMARQPMLQEALTGGLADRLMRGLNSKGAAVLVKGFHLCMAARGPRSHESTIVTTAFRGNMENSDSPLREEFFSLLQTRSFSPCS